MSNSVWPHRRQPTRLPVPGILQARTLEQVAISFSNAWKWKVKVKSLSHVQLLETPWTAAYQAPSSTGFSMQEYLHGKGVGCHCLLQVMSDSLQTHGLQHTRLPVLHCLPEFAQTHVGWVGDAIQTPHPLWPPSPPALNLSQHQDLFQWIVSLH